jgi:hypothetical protein
VSALAISSCVIRACGNSDSSAVNSSSCISESKPRSTRVVAPVTSSTLRFAMAATVRRTQLRLWLRGVAASSPSSGCRAVVRVFSSLISSSRTRERRTLRVEVRGSSPSQRWSTFTRRAKGSLLPTSLKCSRMPSRTASGAIPWASSAS